MEKKIIARLNRQALNKRICVFILILFTAAKVFSSDFLQPPESFQMTGGVFTEVYMDDSSNSLAYSPVFTFFMGRVITGDFPVAEAGFLSQTGSVTVETQIFTNLQQRSMDSSTDKLEDTTVGFDIDVNWIWDKIPLTISFPYTEKRIRWKQELEPNSNTVAILHYHTMAGELGYYIFPNTEVSVGFGYMQPDLFYKTDPANIVYSYLAWDISLFTISGKTVLDLPGRSWLLLEPTYSLIKDQENNKLTGGSLSVVYYPLQTLGIGVSGSTSTFSGGDNYWNDLMEVMGATKLGVSINTSLLPWLDLECYFNRTTPEKEGYDPVSVVGLKALVRM